MCLDSWTRPSGKHGRIRTPDNAKSFDHPPLSSLQVLAQSGHLPHCCSLRNTKCIKRFMLWLYVGPKFSSAGKCVATKVRAGNAQVQMAPLHVLCNIFSQLLTVIALGADIKCFPCFVLVHPDFGIDNLFDIYGRKKVMIRQSLLFQTHGNLTCPSLEEPLLEEFRWYRYLWANRASRLLQDLWHWPHLKVTLTCSASMCL